jgi:hypothetical protein
MMIEKVVSACDTRFKERNHKNACAECTYLEFCPNNCEKCLDFIHTKEHAPVGAPDRKYDCKRMADFYVCKYSCRYTSEMVYALRKLRGLSNKDSIKVLSFGCGPCTDLLALDYLRTQGDYRASLSYIGVDYSEKVWADIHTNIESFLPSGSEARFFYMDVFEFMLKIRKSKRAPDLVVFQYFLSDMHRHSGKSSVLKFLKAFAQFINDISHESYIILNDVNLGTSYNGGRDYFDTLSELLKPRSCRYGRFCNDNSRSPSYPRGYPYGDDSDGEFPCNRNIFSLPMLDAYSPFTTCASAQMIIGKDIT